MFNERKEQQQQSVGVDWGTKIIIIVNVFFLVVVLLCVKTKTHRLISNYNRVSVGETQEAVS